jgi:hypothetical protein
MTAATEADDPHAIAVAAWYLCHMFRASGQHDQAHEIATSAAGLLPADTGDPETVTRLGLLALARALSYAKTGAEGSAWRHWDTAAALADRLPAGYVHPSLMFGRPAVDAYAITMETDLCHAGQAIRRADGTDVRALPSRTRRSFHTIETARAHSLAGQPAAVLHFLRTAFELSPETFRYDLFARSATTDLATRGGNAVRHDAADLADAASLPL